MIIVFIILQITISTDAIISGHNLTLGTNKSYYLILTSVIVMIVNYFIYVILA